jgi:pimeloyl-ACP methyl ester carboxylesterase
MTTATITPLDIRVPDADLADLKSRLAAARYARPAPVADWSRGVPSDYLRSLATYWADGFDWRKHEAELAQWPHFTTAVDGQTIHFIHVRSKHPGALPLILCHGWPGSVAEYAKLIGPLTDPVAYGGKAADAFDVVIPSLPGFGWSVPLASPGWDLARTTHAYAEIMRRLGYSRYMTHGCDIGAGIAGHLASFNPDNVLGVHSCMERAGMSNVGVFLPMPDDLTDEEKATLDGIKAEAAERGGYAEQQGTRPQTLAYGLGDSPIGQLAWIAEKFAEWTNPSKPLPDEAVDRDHLLANVSLYWFTNTAGSSAQFYYEARHSTAGWTAPSSAPTGFSIFDAHPIVRRMMDPEHKAAFWSEHKEGGHFPAMEAPEALTADLRAFARQLR